MSRLDSAQEPHPDPFGKYGLAWFEAGWPVVPLPEGAKTPPPNGYTGRDHRAAEREKVEAWAREQPEANLAVVLTRGVVGVDVDHYADKTGAVSLAELVAEFGELPPTIRTTARGQDNPSGIRWFRVAEGVELPGKLGDAIEAIQHFHRYAVVPPSWNPKSRSRYEAFDDRDGERLTEPFTRDQLPGLPEAWVEGLQRPASGNSGSSGGNGGGAVADIFADELDGANVFLCGVPGVAIPQGIRDDWTFTYANWLRSHDIPIERALELVGRVTYERPDDPDDPFTPRMAEAKVQHAYGTYRGREELSDAEEKRFWAARPMLAHLGEFARARRVGPWAVLGCGLARAACKTGPHVTLPPIIGQKASLNLAVGLVGVSGGGKGTAYGAARDAIKMGSIAEVTPGSGEGIAKSYAHYNSKAKPAKVERTEVAVLFRQDEIDGLIATGSRPGATLWSELCRGLMGEPLGYAYSDPTKRVPIEANTYRLALVAGIQPEKAGRLLDLAPQGVPQRFLWFRVTDPDAPDVAPDEPSAMRWESEHAYDMPGPPDPALLVVPAGAEAIRPLRSTDPERLTEGDAPPAPEIEMQVAGSVRAKLDADRLGVLRGEHPPGLDAHGNLLQLKVAALLALLDGRLDVTEADWRLAATVKKVSDRTRGEVQEVISAAHAAGNRARGKAEGERAAIVSETVEEAVVVKTMDWVLGKLAEIGKMPKRDLQSKCTPGRREYLDEALQRLNDTGQVSLESVEARGGPGEHYSLASR